MIRVIRNKLEEEIVFTISLVLAIVTGFFAPTRVEAIDLKVILSLFNLMLIALAFEKYHFLDFIALSILSKVKSPRSIGFTMILTTAFLGMFITNDVALITVVPITLQIGKKAGFDPFKIIALETVAANIGSSLTPFGNPQNLFLYSFYSIPTRDFFVTVLPFVIIGLLFLLVYNMRNDHHRMEFSVPKLRLHNKKQLVLYGVLFIGVLLSVLRIVDYFIVSGLVILIFVVRESELFRKVDYFLLGTFVCFFIFIDHVMNFPFLQQGISQLLSTEMTTFFVSVGLSQVISNVPTAILLSGFTTYSQALLLGVSVGGMGTMIASLANLISYKLYTKTYSGKLYKTYFYRLNILGLILGCALCVLLIGG